jgi:hypothetical protein
VGKLNILPIPQGFIETGGKLPGGGIADRLVHANHVGDMLGDRPGLHLGVASVE